MQRDGVPTLLLGEHTAIGLLLFILKEGVWAPFLVKEVE